MAISRARKALLIGLASALAVTATTIGMAHAGTGSVAVTAASADDLTSAVEDLTYPNADSIQAETGALLKRGDGHLLLTTCNGSQDILVMTRTGQKDFCFDVIAKPAFLSLEIPKAYGIWTSADPVKNTIKEADGTTTVITAPANDFTGYGEAAADPEQTTLIELRITG
jgi:hypothetical protein